VTTEHYKCEHVIRSGLLCLSKVSGVGSILSTMGINVHAYVHVDALILVCVCVPCSLWCACRRGCLHF